jgi:hypothetical protein
MKIFNSYAAGFKSAFNTKKLVTTIYVITFLMALMLAIPFGTTIQKEAGNSMAFSALLKGFDYTVYQDFMNHSRDAIQPYIATAIWIGIFYLLFTIFFEGGILTVLKRKEDKFTLRFFWEASAKYFSRFLRLAVYMIIVQAVTAVIFFIILAQIISSVYKSAPNEISIFYTFVAGVVIYLVIFIFLLTVTDYAKVMLVENEVYRPFRTILRSFGFVFKHFLSTYFLYLLLLIVPILLFAIYFKLESAIGMTSGWKILIIFIIQQLLVWSRVFTKIWILGSELNLYRNFEKKEEITEGEPVFGI